MKIIPFTFPEKSIQVTTLLNLPGNQDMHVLASRAENLTQQEKYLKILKIDAS